MELGTRVGPVHIRGGLTDEYRQIFESPRPVPESWRAGHRTVEVIALFGAQESAPAGVRFKVVGIPEDSSIRAAGSSREECGEACNHRPFTGTW